MTTQFGVASYRAHGQPKQKQKTPNPPAEVHACPKLSCPVPSFSIGGVTWAPPYTRFHVAHSQVLRVRLRTRLIVFRLAVRTSIGFLSVHYQMLLLKADPKQIDSPWFVLTTPADDFYFGAQRHCCWVSEQRWRWEAFRCQSGLRARSLCFQTDGCRLWMKG